MKFSYFFFLLLLLGAGLVHAQQSVYVDQAGDFTPANPVDGDTITWKAGTPDEVTSLIFGTKAFTSVQAAVDAVDPGGTVFIADGEYFEGSVITIIDKILTLQGDGAESTSLLRDDSLGEESTNKHSILSISRLSSSVLANLIINNLHISGGRSDQESSGGGISCNGATVIVNHSTISENFSSGNSSGGGFGGVFFSGSNITVNHSTVSGNSSSGNFSGGGFGGAFFSGSNIIVNHSSILGNSSSGDDSGGGFGSNGATITINHSTVSENSSSGNSSGGGFGASDSTITVNNSTVSGNSSSGNSSGGGFGGSSGDDILAIALVDGDVDGGFGESTDRVVPITLVNSLVVGNTGDGFNSSPEIDGDFMDNGGNLTSLGTFTIEQILEPLADNGGPTLTHALVPGSPAINAGDNSLIPAGITSDQRSFVRVSDGTVDIGAFEASFVFVDAADDFTITTNVGADGTILDNGDTVTWKTGTPEEVTDLTFGSNAFTSVQNAVTTVDSGGTVFIAAGDYLEAAEVTITKSLTLQGDRAASSTLSGNDAHRVIDITQSTAVVVINHLSIRNGQIDLSVGGGINNSGILTINHSTLSGNSANVGGGIFSQLGASLTINNSTLSGNSALNGGGIVNDRSPLTVNNATLTGNSATRQGVVGGLGGGILNPSGILSINNSIVAGNTAPDGPDINGSFTSGGVNFIGDLTGSTGFGSGTDLSFVSTSTTIDQVLNTTLADNGGPTLTHALLPNSPAIDTGENTTIPVVITTDQRGFARIVGNSVDIGAFEASAPISLTTWRLLHGLAVDGSEDLENPSGDGVENILKYAFNIAPNAGDLLIPNTSIVEANGTAGLPLIEINELEQLVITFIRRKANTTPGIIYSVETGEDLSGWNAVNLSAATVESIDAIWERVTVIDSTVTAELFGRIGVEILTP